MRRLLLFLRTYSKARGLGVTIVDALRAAHVSSH